MQHFLLNILQTYTNICFQHSYVPSCKAAELHPYLTRNQDEINTAPNISSHSPRYLDSNVSVRSLKKFVFSQCNLIQSSSKILSEVVEEITWSGKYKKYIFTTVSNLRPSHFCAVSTIVIVDFYKMQTICFNIICQLSSYLQDGKKFCFSYHF
jgi:hypothetical protein